MSSLPKNYLHSSSNHLYLLTVLTNMEGGLRKQTSLSLSPSTPVKSCLAWSNVQSKRQASMGRLRASPHFHLIMRTPSHRLRRLLNPFPLSFPTTDTMGEVSTPQARCTTSLQGVHTSPHPAYSLGFNEEEKFPF